MSTNFINQDEIQLISLCVSAKIDYVHGNMFSLQGEGRLDAASRLGHLYSLSDKLLSYRVGLSFAKIDMDFAKNEISLIVNCVSYRQDYLDVIPLSHYETIDFYRLLDKLHHYREGWIYDDKSERMKA